MADSETKQVTVFINSLLNNVHANSFCTETSPCVAHNESVHFQVCLVFAKWVTHSIMSACTGLKQQLRDYLRWYIWFTPTLDLINFHGQKKYWNNLQNLVFCVPQRGEKVWVNDDSILCTFLNIHQPGNSSNRPQHIWVTLNTYNSLPSQTFWIILLQCIYRDEGFNLISLPFIPDHFYHIDFLPVKYRSILPWHRGALILSLYGKNIIMFKNITLVYKQIK